MNPEGMAALAGLLADRTRASFCLALMDGRAWTAGELARQAGVAVSTASSHLDRLVAGGLLTEHRQGRHRYLRLAGPGVAGLVEELSSQLPPRSAPVRSLRVANRDAALARGRTCYDHLAGRLGVLLLEAMTTKDLVVRETGLALTDRGVAWLAGLGVDVAALRSGRRPMTRDCLDWTERRPHLAGAAGAALCQRFFETGWIVRSHGSRAVRLTPAGLRGLNASLGITEQQLAA